MTAVTRSLRRGSTQIATGNDHGRKPIRLRVRRRLRPGRRGRLNDLLGRNGGSATIPNASPHLWKSSRNRPQRRQRRTRLDGRRDEPTPRARSRRDAPDRRGSRARADVRRRRWSGRFSAGAGDAREHATREHPQVIRDCLDDGISRGFGDVGPRASDSSGMGAVDKCQRFGAKTLRADECPGCGVRRPDRAPCRTVGRGHGVASFARRDRTGRRTETAGSEHPSIRTGGSQSPSRPVERYSASPPSSPTVTSTFFRRALEDESCNGIY